ncbi:MAG: 2-phospho-L-lactate guanylyltransferase, partial [Nocardioides sp.]
TTLYTAPYDAFDPHFGRGSRRAHLGSGAREITLEVESLRLDVDDATALALAEALGVGAHTRLALLG